MPHLQSIAFPGGIAWYKAGVAWHPEIEPDARTTIKEYLMQRFVQHETHDIKDMGGCLRRLFPPDLKHEKIREMLAMESEK